jgi:transcriptional regulator with XRE-family HTH domain
MMNPDWRTALREARHASRLSLKVAGERSRLSYETVRGYENGRRSPTRDSLLKLLSALELTAADANALLERAGFAPDAGLYAPDEFPEYAFRVDELQRFIEKRPWPAIATDDAIRVLAVNQTMQALWGFDFAREKRRRSRDEMSLFAIIGDFGFLERITNWPAFLRAAASLNKGRPLRASLMQPARLIAATKAMAGGDPALVKRMLRIWTKAKPMPARIQADFPIIWRDPELGEMRFRSVVSVASERDRLNFRDWHPVDADTWRALERVKARAGRRVQIGRRDPQRTPRATDVG